VPPVRVEDCEPGLQKLLAHVPAMPDGTPLNVFTTLANHGPLFSAWLPFGAQLLMAGKLPARTRELLILRTSWLCQVEYEWGHHVPLAQLSGVTDDEIAAVITGPSAWDGEDALLLTAVDELHHEAKISDATWTALTKLFATDELVELVMVVGQYHLAGFALNSLGVQLEPGFTGFPKP
jgi:alkylhydroperoxidase family enzyme